MLRGSFALLLFIAAILCRADVADHGPYRIHYTTFKSTLIPPEVASVHGIKRSDNLIVLNVSIRKGEAPSRAVISGEVLNLLNQRFDLEFDEVIEADAIYYLASHIAMEQDILRFSITVQPPGEDPYPIAFLRRYD